MVTSLKHLEKYGTDTFTKVYSYCSVTILSKTGSCLHMESVVLSIRCYNKMLLHASTQRVTYVQQMVQSDVMSSRWYNRMLLHTSTWRVSYYLANGSMECCCTMMSESLGLPFCHMIFISPKLCDGMVKICWTKGSSRDVNLLHHKQLSLFYENENIFLVNVSVQCFSRYFSDVTVIK